MAQCRNVLEAATEKPGRDPACISEDPATLFRLATIEEIRVIPQSAATANASRPAEREEISVREKRKVHCVGRVLVAVDLVVHDIEDLLIEEAIQHEDEHTTVRRFAGIVRAHLCWHSIQSHRHKAGNRDRDLIDDRRVEIRVPVLLHHVVELSALYRVGKLDMISRTVAAEPKVGRVQRRLLERGNRHYGGGGQVGVLQLQRHGHNLCRDGRLFSQCGIVAHHGERPRLALASE